MHLTDQWIRLSDPPANILKHLGFHSFLPHPSLRNWVQCYWIARQRHISGQGFTEKLYPDGGTNINFRFCPDQLPNVSFNAFQALNTMHFQRSIDLLGIRFHPGGAFQLFGLDMPALVGRSHNASDMDSDLNNRGLHELRERLAVNQDTRTRVGLLDDWLLQQAVYRQAQQGPVQHLLHYLAHTDGTVDGFSAEVNISRRHLERRFQQEAGFTMVSLKQLLRIRKARRLISCYPGLPLVDVAQETGFYDQAHFIRQFQKINLQTPGQYQARKRAQISSSVHINTAV